MLIVICEECGLRFSAEQTGLHQQYHDAKLYGLQSPAIDSDRLILEHEGWRVTVVGPNSPEIQKRRIEQVSLQAWQMESCLLRPPYSIDEHKVDSIHAFLLYYEVRLIGFLLIRNNRMPITFRVAWESSRAKYVRTVDEDFPSRSISAVWVHPAYRRQGGGKLLVKAAEQFFEGENLAWEMPFYNNIEALVRSQSRTKESFLCES